MTEMVRLALVCLAAVGAASVPASHVFAQDGREEVESGNRLYEEGRYSEAHARYLEALEKAPGLPLARFNEGNALYRSQEFQRAMEAYMEALENGDPEWRSQAWYNLGNALARQQQAGAAAEAYKEALRLDPSDVDAKHNLEMALMQLDQQQQQQQNQGGDGSDGDQQDQQDESRQGQDQQQGGSSEQDPQNQPNEGEPGTENESPENEDVGGQGDPSQSENEDGEGQAAEAPGRMTPEQAERLMQAIDEDPGEVNRKAAQVRGRRPRKDW